jgi:acyl carrier protein
MTYIVSPPHAEAVADIAAEIRLLIGDKLGIHSLTAGDEDLVAAGILDSLTLVQLLFDLETRFGIMIPLEELEIDDVRSIAALAHLVTSRRLPSAGEL